MIWSRNFGYINTVYNLQTIPHVMNSAHCIDAITLRSRSRCLTDQTYLREPTYA